MKMRSLLGVLSSPLTIHMVWSPFVLMETPADAQCTMCPNGEDPDPLFGAKRLGITAPIAVPDCNAMSSIMVIVPEDNDLCPWLRYTSTYCGCPRAQDACQLCPASRPVMKNKDTNLDFLLDSLPLNNDQVLEGVSGGTLTCELLDSAISTFTRGDPTCLLDESLQTICGCTEEDTVDNVDAWESCSFCAGGEDLPYDVSTTTTVRFQDPTSEPISCQTLFDIALETENGTSLCASIQQHTYSCGCPERKESACKVCDDQMLNEESLLVVDGVTTNCQNYEAKLRTMSSLDEKCVVNDDMIEACGCAEPCSVCPGGEPVGFPDKEITIVAQELLEGFFATDKYTCGMVQTALVGERKGSEVCQSANFIAKVCGCPPREGACNLCGQSGSIMTKPDAQFIAGYNDVIARHGDALATIFPTGPTFNGYFTNELLSCEFIDSAMNILSDEGSPESCFPIQLSNSHHCGCSPPNQKGVALLWTQRSFAIVSMMGSIMIILFIMLWDKKKRFTTYNQILLGVSSFDFISSFALSLGSLPASSDLGIYGAKGNIHTCQLQGFMYQLGLTSISYNVVLSSYFLIVIKYGWTERKFKRISKWVHLAVLVVGFGMAFGSIPFHQGHLRWCYINRPPVEDSYVPAVMFFVAPVSIAILVITVLTVLMVTFVVRQERKTMNRSMRRSKATLSRQTLWQSLMYLLAFYLVWPLMFASYLVWMGPESYWLFMLASILGPSQGLFNAIVFFHRKRGALSKIFRRVKCCKKKQSPQTALNTQWLGDSSSPGTSRTRTDRALRGSMKSSAFFFLSRRFSPCDIKMAPQGSELLPSANVETGGCDHATTAVAQNHNELVDAKDHKASPPFMSIDDTESNQGGEGDLYPTKFDGEDVDESIQEEPTSNVEDGNCEVIVRNKTNDSATTESQGHPPKDRPALSAIQPLGSDRSVARSGRSIGSGRFLTTTSCRSVAGSGRSITGRDERPALSAIQPSESDRSMTRSGRSIGSGRLLTARSGRSVEGSGRSVTGADARPSLSSIQASGSDRSITRSGRSVTGSDRFVARRTSGSNRGSISRNESFAKRVSSVLLGVDEIDFGDLSDYEEEADEMELGQLSDDDQ